MVTEPIHVEGLSDFVRALKRMNSDLPKAVRVANNLGAKLVVDRAVPRIPSRTGRARRSVRASSTRTAVRVTGGSRRVPYYPWLDFGGKTGRRRSVERPFYKEGRYLYKAYFEVRDELPDVLTAALVDVARQAGLEVD